MQFKQTRFSSTADAIEKLKLDVDIAAGNARARYITTVQGQEAVYTEKMRQARLYIEQDYPADMTGFEMITAEANARETNAAEAADFIKSTADYWNNVLSPNIEQWRVGTKNKLSALDETATTQDAVTLAYHAIQTLNAI